MWRNEVADCCFQNTLIRFRTNPNLALPEFALAVFLSYFRSGKFAAVGSQTSNVAHLGAARFAQMPFPLPPISLQRAFVERMDEIRSAINHQITTNQRLEDLFQSLLARAFSGELTAAWREQHAEQLHEEVIQRDVALGLRDAEPTVGDLAEGRATRAEREQAERQIQQDIEKLRQSAPLALLTLIDESFSASTAPSLNTVLAHALQPIDWDELVTGMPKDLQLQATEVADSFRSIQQQARATPALQQSPELAAQMVAAYTQLGQLYQHAQALANNRAVRAAFDKRMNSLIERIAQAPAYFRAEDLADNDGGIGAADEGLRVLAALGYVRPVMVRGQVRYRRVDSIGERVIVEELAG
jgi:hypothetical protein